MPTQPSSPSPDRDDFGILLGLAYQRFVDALNAHLHERGFEDIGTSFGYVFRALAVEALTATQLAARLHLTPQGAAKIADDMVKRGYVERQVDPRDGRARRLVLAPRGKQALTEARAFHAAFERRLSQSCGDERVAELRLALEVVIAGEDGRTTLDTSPRLLRPL